MSNKPLTLGMVGEKVAALHQSLTQQGFSIPEVETKKQFFGPATRMTVGEFQKAHGIEPSCEVCMATAAKLRTTLAANAAANYSQPQGQVLTAQVGTAANDNQPQGQVEYLQVGTANYNQPQGQTFSSQVGSRQQPIQDGSKRKMPTHLSVFALAKSTGHPIARMPFYAEVGVVSVSALPQPKCNLQEAIRIGSEEFITSTPYFLQSPTRVEKLVELLCDTLYRLLAPAIVDRWVKDQASAAGAITGILQTASELAKYKRLDWDNPQMLGQLLEEAILAYAKGNNLPLAEANAQGARIVWAHPLGVLATDHVGYLSFDLTRLPQDVADAVALALEARRRNPTAPTETSIWLYPMAQEEGRIDALAQMRFAHDAIVVKLELDVELDPELCQPKLCESIKNLGITAMQNPNLTDWRLSPGSFATNPGALVGADGCETILPANVAVQEFYFYQVIRLTGADINNDIKLGVVHEYRIAWYPLGHSLGQILYSLPLAPGETVNLAVIDWTRRDEAQRKERTTLDEQLFHNEHRDRIISETVNASVNEYQHGSSFMGGIAGSYGAALGAGGMGAAAGISGGIGGATSNSSGSRKIAADTVQKLSDNITQFSTAQRELQSTVVVHSTQSEHEAIETRTVVNYNHSHTLTILYYEVLRHFRVATELVRRRPAVLVKLRTDWFEGTDAARNILEHRAVLEAALLDTKYAEGFNAIERLSHRGEPLNPLQDDLADFTKPLRTPTNEEMLKLNPPYIPQQAGPELRFFVFDIKTGGMSANIKETNQDVLVFAKLWPMGLDLLAGNGGTRLSQPGAFSFQNADNSFVGHVQEREINDAKGGKIKSWSVFWGEIDKVVIYCNQENTDVSFQHITITAIDVDGHPLVLFDKEYAGGGLVLTNEWHINLPTLRPPRPAIPPYIPFYDPAAAADHTKGVALVAHLKKHTRYYSRAILLNQNPVERAGDLDDIKLSDGSTALEHLDSRPLEIVGDYVAYPSTDLVWNERIKPSLESQPGDAELHLDERLVTLPTRGVFAEAKLGHCNASEIEDPTRFWKWDEHPIPHSAPEIAAIAAGKHTVKDPNLQSTPFPQSLVNIVNPPNAPDPTGLASAMNVLAASNIFRDMSGRAEVADLLKKLSDNSVAIAGVAQNAATGGVGKGGAGAGSVRGSANTGSSPSSGSKSSGSGSGGSAGQRSSTPGTPQTVAEVNDLASGIRNHLPPAQANPMVDQLYQNVVDNAGTDAKLQLGFAFDAEGGVFPTRYPEPLRSDTKLQQALDAARNNLAPADRSKLDNVAITIVELTSSGTLHGSASHRGNEVHYSASLLKVAAVYAAFELRAAARRLVATQMQPPSHQALLDELRSQFNPQIKGSLPFLLVSDRRVNDSHILPTYDKVLSATVDFEPTFLNMMRSIFTNQRQNTGAQYCIHQLGYGYMNCALAAAGFFDEGLANGIWFAGDYSNGTDWPSVKIPCLNDVDTAQAATTDQLGKLFTLLFDKKLFDDPQALSSRNEMLDLMAPAGSWFDQFWPRQNSPIWVTHAKVGEGPLKTGGNVLSEGAIVHEGTHNTDFAIVWQNLKGDPTAANLKPLAEMIETTIRNFFAP